MKTYIGTFLKLLLASFLFSIVLLLLLAFLFYKFYLSDDVITVSIILIYVISNFLSGFLAGKTMGRRKYVWGLGLGAAYFIVLCLVSFAVKQSFADLGQDFLMTMILCLGSGMLGGMVS